MAIPNRASTTSDEQSAAIAGPKRSGTRAIIEPRSTYDKTKAYGDKPVTPAVIDDKPIPPGNESSYGPRAGALDEAVHEQTEPRQQGGKLTVESPGFAHLTEEQRREAVAALATLLAPLVTSRIIHNRRSAT